MDMVTEKLKKEIGMIAKPLPGKLRTMEAELPSGRMRFENALYQADKLKKITIGKHIIGETGVGTLIMIVADDEYDLPFIIVDIAFDSSAKGEIFAEFEAKPLVKDDESTQKYVEPFRKWREALGKLPAEPLPEAKEIGEFLKANHSPNEYMGLIPSDYADEVLKFAGQFFDIFIDIYRKAEPVKDTERRRKMQAFRVQYNKHVLDEDPSAILLTNAFGRQTAELFYEYLVNL